MNNKIHIFESSSQNIPEGENVFTRCGKEIPFVPIKASMFSGVICVVCDGSRNGTGRSGFRIATVEEAKTTAST